MIRLHAYIPVTGLITVSLVVCLTAETARAQQTRKAQHVSSVDSEQSGKSQGAQKEAQITGQRIKLADGTVFEADEVWKDGNDIWYRRGNISQILDRAVLSVVSNKTSPPASAKASEPEKPESKTTFWVYIVGGARVKVEEVSETEEGTWYRRGNLSVFIERERIARIECEVTDSTGSGWSEGSWTTGNGRIDDLIRLNGARFGVDPYLIFLVMDQESRFKTRAVSPKGARGLMQLMPGTAARFGVRNSFDPAENIQGGTQYLRELMQMFAGQVNLVLASYNAGERTVIRYGRAVPPFRETREYVKRISRKYGKNAELDRIQDASERLSPVQR